MNYIMDEVQDDTEVHQVSKDTVPEGPPAPATLALEVPGASLRPASGKWQAPILEEVPLCSHCHSRNSSHLVPQIEGCAVCYPCYEELVYELQSQDLRRLSLIYGFIWGTAFAVASAVVWSALTSTYKLEFGYLGWLLGYLAGRGVIFGAGKSRGHSLQIIAAIAALIGLGMRKYLSFILLYAHQVMNRENVDIGIFSKDMGFAVSARLINSVNESDVIWGVLAVFVAYLLPRRKYLSFAFPNEQFESSSSIHPASLLAKAPSSEQEQVTEIDSNKAKL